LDRARLAAVNTPLLPVEEPQLDAYGFDSFEGLPGGL